MRGGLIAHRGGVFGTNFSENSLEAFSQAITKGTKGLECDLRKSKDGEIVIVHDPTIINGMEVINLNFKEIREIVPHICKAIDLLELVSQEAPSSYVVNLEIKEYDLYKDVFKLVTQFPQLNIFITSFLHSEIEHLQNLIIQQKHISLGLLFESYPLNMKEIIENTKYNIVIREYVLPKDKRHTLFDLLLRNSKRITVYTVNDIEKIVFYQSCGFNVITDSLISF